MSEAYTDGRLRAGDTITVTCGGCGESFTYLIRGSGRLPKWCSERCRKRQYDRVCARCGGRASGTDPGTTKSDLCAECWKAEVHETSAARLIAEAHRWFDLYGQQPSAYEWHVSELRWKQRAYAEGRTNGRPAEATIIELERRHREDGPWPAKTSALNAFGSWNGFIEAAGFEPLKVGQKRKAAA